MRTDHVSLGPSTVEMFVKLKFAGFYFVVQRARSEIPMFGLTQSIKLSNSLLANFRGLVLGCIEADCASK